EVKANSLKKDGHIYFTLSHYSNPGDCFVRDISGKKEIKVNRDRDSINVINGNINGLVGNIQGFYKNDKVIIPIIYDRNKFSIQINTIAGAAYIIGKLDPFDVVVNMINEDIEDGRINVDKVGTGTITGAIIKVKRSDEFSIPVENMSNGTIRARRFNVEIEDKR
ncbi:26002_t:CDS:1, partial [Gigaspora rosea]